MIPQPTPTFVSLGPSSSLGAPSAPQPAKAFFRSITARYDSDSSSVPPPGAVDSSQVGPIGSVGSHEVASGSLHEVGSPWPTGRLVELSGRAAAGARTTAAVREVVRQQREGELVAWIQTRGGTFYPPDAAEAGVDLASLTVVHVPSSALEAARAAELLLRSGAFGLVLVDLEGMVDARLPSRALARLHALCRQHDSTVAFLTPPAQEALGSLVSLRLEPRRIGAHAQLTHELVSLDDTAFEASKLTERSEPSFAERDTAVPQSSVLMQPVMQPSVPMQPSVRIETSDGLERSPSSHHERERSLELRRPLELHVVESEVRRDKIGHEPARSIHRGPLGLTKHDEVATQPGVVLPFRRRTSDDATLPLPFFEARDAG